MKYSEKFKDPRWQKKRLEVMEYAGFKCEDCGDSKSTLNVHHTIYFKKSEPWEYDRKYLRCLCERCHETHHALRQHLSFMLAEMDSVDLSFILGAAYNVCGVMKDRKNIQFLNRYMSDGFFCAGMGLNVSKYTEKVIKSEGVLTQEMLDEIINGESSD